MSVLMALAFASFGWLCWRKLQIVLALQPDPRWDHPWQRLRTVLVNGLMQRRMVQREWRPGLMHALIFLGFMSLLLRKLQLIGIGYQASLVFPDAFGGPFAAFKDGVEVAVTAKLALPPTAVVCATGWVVRVGAPAAVGPSTLARSVAAKAARAGSLKKV